MYIYIFFPYFICHNVNMQCNGLWKNIECSVIKPKQCRKTFLISFLLIVITHSVYNELVLSLSEQSLPNTGTRKLYWTLCRCT